MKNSPPAITARKISSARDFDGWSKLMRDGGAAETGVKVGYGGHGDATPWAGRG